ncbi:MAG: FadR/GntR family transcriptional regulator [Janthinobacterium lividum]
MPKDRQAPLPLNMAARVASEIREEIASAKLKPDEFLPPEHMLMLRFAVSRPTLREALRILQSEGLVKIIRGSRGGAMILAPDPRRIAAYAGVLLQMRNTTIIEVFEARILVEPDALARVAQIGDRAVLSTLSQNVAAQHFLIEDRPAFYRAGRDFREVFLENCGSEALRLIGLMLGYIADRQLSLLSERLPYSVDQEARFLTAVRLKETMLEAMVGRRFDDVRACWVQYLRTYMNDLLKTTPDALRSMEPFPLV